MRRYSLRLASVAAIHSTVPADPPIFVFPLSLDTLLDVHRLRSEIVVLQQAVSGTGKNTLVSPTPLDVRSDVSRVLQGVESLYENYDSNVFDDSSAFAFVDHLNTAAETISGTVGNARLDVLKSCLNVGIYRGVRYLYHWYAKFGPRLADALFAHHQATGNGPQGVQSMFPRLAELVNAIMRWLDRVKRAKDAGLLTDLTSEEAISCATLHVPADLYGLNKSTKKKGPISLALPIRYSVQTSKDRCDLGQKIWLEAVSNELILEEICQVDLRLNAGSRSSRSTDLCFVKARCISRGAILDCLLDWLDDDGIFASEKLADLLQHPAALFDVSSRKDNAVAAKILRDPDAALQPLIDRLSSHYDVVETQNTVRELRSTLGTVLDRFSLLKPAKLKRVRRGAETKLMGDVLVPLADPTEPLADLTSPFWHSFLERLCVKSRIFLPQTIVFVVYSMRIILSRAQNLYTAIQTISIQSGQRTIIIVFSSKV